MLEPVPLPQFFRADGTRLAREDGFTFDDNTFQTAVTSPPYWKARDYGHGPDQLGLEDRVADYIDNLVHGFDRTRDVLRDDGTLWVIIGDSYNTRAKVRPTAHNPGLGHSDTVVGDSATESWRERSAKRLVKHSARSGSSLKEKDLAYIPSRFAIAMVDHGWYLRAEVIWNKPYGKPERVHDRPSLAHEKVFLFTKSPTYLFFKTDPVRRSVWNIPPGSGIKNLSGPAVLPTTLAEYCIAASTTATAVDPVHDLVLDPYAGAGVVLHTARRLGRRAVGTDLSDEWWDPTLSESGFASAPAPVPAV